MTLLKGCWPHVCLPSTHPMPVAIWRDLPHVQLPGVEILIFTQKLLFPFKGSLNSEFEHIHLPLANIPSITATIHNCGACGKTTARSDSHCGL
jgi:hypothetical protein